MNALPKFGPQNDEVEGLLQRLETMDEGQFQALLSAARFNEDLATVKATATPEDSVTARRTVMEVRLDAVNKMNACVVGSERFLTWDAARTAARKLLQIPAGSLSPEVCRKVNLVLDTVCAVAARDLLDERTYDTLTLSWRAAFGPITADDAPVDINKVFQLTR